MIDGMNEVLEGEQVADDKQDVWCLAELDKAKDEAKATEQDVGDLSAEIDQQRDTIAALASEIEALKKGLEDLDKSVAEAFSVVTSTSLISKGFNIEGHTWQPTLVDILQDVSVFVLQVGEVDNLCDRMC